MAILLELAYYITGNGRGQVPLKQIEKVLKTFVFRTFGPSAEIRTQGLLNPIQARYQTSPHPEVFCWLSASDSLVIIAYPREKCKSFFRFFEKFFLYFLSAFFTRSRRPRQVDLAPEDGVGRAGHKEPALPLLHL